MQLAEKQMDLLSDEDLQRLLTNDASACVTIYMPTYRSTDATLQGPIRLKNLLDEATTQLEARGVRRPTIEALLAPAAALVDQRDFWQHQSDGLALFLQEDGMQRFRLPIHFDEQVVTGSRFYLKPLLPLLGEEGHFYILALSQNDVRLFEATRFALGQIDLGEAMQSMEDYLAYFEFEESLQHHSTGSGGAAMIHGHGGSGDDANSRLSQFLKQLDNVVRDFISSDRAPLVLAGVEHVQAIYRQVSHSNTLVAAGIDGNPEELSGEELHAQAWTLVESHFDADRRVALENLHMLIGRQDERAEQALDGIVPAAYFQRVDTLFVDPDFMAWGTFDANANQVTRHEEPAPDDRELADFAMAHTLLNGGKVYAITPEDLPEGEAVAAIYRY